jgi:hypothetical protein
MLNLQAVRSLATRVLTGGDWAKKEGLAHFRLQAAPQCQKRGARAACGSQVPSQHHPWDHTVRDSRPNGMPPFP